MKKFWTYVLATIVGSVVVTTFFGIMFFVLLACLSTMNHNAGLVANKAVLRIHLNGTLAERSEMPSPIDELLGRTTESASQGLDELKLAIRTAATDKRVQGIYLEGGHLIGDIASFEELRKELLEFKKSKKFIYAYADVYSQGSYYLASTADKIFINPSGLIEWKGLASQPIFYTGLLEKLGVKMQVFKVGTYKSAVEPFILKNMSAANRKQMSALLGDLWNSFVAHVGESRRLSADSLNAYANRYTQLSDASHLKRMKLVDELAYIDQVREALHKKVNTTEEEFSFVHPNDLLADTQEKTSSETTVAIYFAEGNIVDKITAGILPNSSTQIVGEQVVENLDALAKDESVKAVVLRINSPGGSAYASEQMWRAIQLLRQKKPVVVSMGGVAASGGYYMACGAHRIFADSTTITGSIGIFGMFPDPSELLTQKLGLNFESVKTNVSADLGAMGRAFDTNESAAIQAFVDRGYRLFLKRVAEGRTAAGKKMTLEQVDQIGQGRVWSGQQALKNGLVDELGTLDQAIAHAAKLAKLNEYSTNSYPLQTSWWASLEQKQDDYLERKLKTALGVYYEPLQFLTGLQQHPQIQAHMFFVPNIR